MIVQPLKTTIICFSIVVFIQCLTPEVTAMKRTSNIDEFTVENERTRKKQNYLVQRNNDLLRDNENYGLVYNMEPFDPEANPEELSAFMVDYGNMIRNDVILLDNSVETRTRKRGNLKVEKYNREIITLEENTYPRSIESRNCSTIQQSCLPPYICKESLYNLTILRKRKSITEQSLLDLPHELARKWVAEKRPISVGCICTRDYVI